MNKTDNRRYSIIVCVVLVIIISAIYGQTYRHGFLNLDDDLYVYENHHIQEGLTAKSIGQAFTETKGSLWIPVTWLSYMVDYELFGLDPGKFHLTNVIFHCLNSILLFLFLNYLMRSLWMSAFIAAVFAVHPMHVESVAWITERKDMLSTFFMLPSLWLYVIYCKRKSPAFYTLSLLSFVLGIMAKPMLVTLPILLILLDYRPLRRLPFLNNDSVSEGSPNKILQTSSHAMYILEKAPFVAVSLAVSLLTLTIGMQHSTLITMQNIPFVNRLSNAIYSYMMYIIKTLVPHKLSIFYPYSPEPLAAWKTALAVIFLVAVTAAVIRNSRRYKHLAVGWMWFLVTLLPVIGLVQAGTQSMADRFMYIPMIGLLMMLVPMASQYAAKRRIGKTSLTLAALVVIAAYSIAASIQVSFWGDSETLFRHALDVSADNYLAHEKVGNILIEMGKPEDALAHYKEALRIKPDYAHVLNNLGKLLADKGEVDDAEKLFVESLRLNPGDSETHNNLANTFLIRGQHDKARENYLEAIRLDPYFVEAHFNLAYLDETDGKSDEAVGNYSKAIRLKPDYAMAHYRLGRLLSAAGKHDEAMTHLKEALRLTPDFVEGYMFLGTQFMSKGEYEKAIEYYSGAARLRPDADVIQSNLGGAYLYLGRIEDAERHYTKALEINPGFVNASFGLGTVMVRTGDFEGAEKRFLHVLSVNPDHAFAHYTLAEILVQRKDFGAAAKHYRETIRIMPDHPEAQKKLQSVMQNIR